MRTFLIPVATQYLNGEINVVCCVGSVEISKSKYKKVGVLPIRIVKSNVSSVGTEKHFLSL